MVKAHDRRPPKGKGRKEEDQVGLPPSMLSRMRRVLETNAEQDRDEADRNMRKWFVSDPDVFMKALRAAEVEWWEEVRKRKRDKERRIEKREEKERAAAGGGAEPGGAVAERLADEGMDRCEELCREVLGRMAAKIRGEGGGTDGG